MVVRTRLRNVLFPLVLYGVSGGIGGYFVWHAVNGDLGLKVSDEYEKSIAMLDKQLAVTKVARHSSERRGPRERGAAMSSPVHREKTPLCEHLRPIGGLSRRLAFPRRLS